MEGPDRTPGQGQAAVIPLIEAVGEPFLPQRNKAPLSPIAVMQNLALRLQGLTRSGRVLIDLGNLTPLFSGRDVAAMLDLLFRGGAFPHRLVTPVARSSSPSTLSEASWRGHAIVVQASACASMA